MKFNFFFILILINSLYYISNEIPNNFSHINNMSSELLSQLTIIDKYKDLAFGAQLGSNNPCEDTFFIQNITLLNTSGIFFTVFDGHGGDKLSQYANLLLYPYFLEAFNINKFIINFNQRIILSLKQAYTRIEQEFLKIAFNERLKNNYAYSQVGTCALSVIVINQKIFVANLGDSKARLFYLSHKYMKKRNDTEQMKVKKLSKVFNIRKKEEQIYYKQKFPKDKDIIKCFNEKACYVKGALQPTRTLGDYTMKYLHFNLDDMNNDVLYEKYKKYFNGPYISSVPDIHVFDIKKNFRYLIIGTDGLWDVMKSRDIASFIMDNKMDNIENITYHLFNNALINYSVENHFNGDYMEILKTPRGKERRDLHDDITIITCDLTKFF